MEYNTDVLEELVCNAIDEELTRRGFEMEDNSSRNGDEVIIFRDEEGNTVQVTVGFKWDLVKEQ